MAFQSMKDEDEAEEKEGAALRSVIKYIKDYGLHSQYSPDILEHCIEELNRQRAIKQQNWRMAKRIEQRNRRRGNRIMNMFNGQKANDRVATPSSPSPAPPAPAPTPILTPATAPVLGPQTREQGPNKRPAAAQCGGLPLHLPTNPTGSKCKNGPGSLHQQKRHHLLPTYWSSLPALSRRVDGAKRTLLEGNRCTL